MDFLLSDAHLRESIQSAVKDLPALPSAVVKVVQETDKSEPSASKVEQHIQKDQGLTTKLLKVVNSAYYGVSGQVTNVQQAIVILGLQQVRNLTLSVGALSGFTSSNPRQQEMLRSCWLHAFSTASASQLIAQHKKLDSTTSQVLFVGGLLHDIGRLFLFTHFPEEYRQVVTVAMETDRPVEDVEAVMLGMNHAQVGSLIAQHWKLPKVISTLIADHEGPFDGTEDEVLMCVHIADALTKHLYYRPPIQFEVLVDPSAVKWLDASPEAFEQLKVEVKERVANASSEYGLMAA